MSQDSATVAPSEKGSRSLITRLDLIDARLTSVCEDLSSLAHDVKSLTTRLLEMREESIKDRFSINSALETMKSLQQNEKESFAELYGKLRAHDDKMVEITRRIDRIEGPMRVVIWVGGTVGAIIVAFLFSLLTGQIRVIFP